MSSISRSVELIDTARPWRHWEMDRLEEPGESDSGSPDTAAAREDRKDSTDEDGRASTAEQSDNAGAAAEDAAADLAKERLEAKAEGYKEGFQKARQAGYEAGLAEGKRKAQADFEKESRRALAPLAELANEFSEAINTMSEDLSGQLVELAMEIGNVMALDAIADNDQIINESIQLILDSEIVSASRPQLLLNPADMELVSSVHGDELTALGWQLRADDKVSRGGCRVKSEQTELDASLETRWRAVTARVRRRRENRDQGHEDETS